MLDHHFIFVTALIHSRGRVNWYDIVFAGLAAIIVYADKVTAWIGDRVQKEQGWATLIATVAFGLIAMWLFTGFLAGAEERFRGYEPILSLSMFAAIRAMMKLVETLFGFDRD